MRITPTAADFEKWINCVPSQGDIIFFKEDQLELLNTLKFPYLTRAQAKEKGPDGPWTLNNRSWYGYALNQADFCVWLMRGKIEELPSSALAQIQKAQSDLHVPTFIEGKWITSLHWSNISLTEKIHIIQLWMLKNEVHNYESIAFEDLPDSVQNEIQKIGLKESLNRFAVYSGPNCFATVAGAILHTKRSEVTEKWMHWTELKSTLEFKNYDLVTDGSPPLSGDALIFSKNGEPLHGAYYLGEGLYFEKPGQDFYEPYRIERFRNWPKEWEGSTLSTWRKVR